MKTPIILFLVFSLFVRLAAAGCKRKQCPIRSGMTWVSARQVGQDGLEVKRNFALHEEDGLAGDEDAG